MFSKIAKTGKNILVFLIFLFFISGCNTEDTPINAEFDDSTYDANFRELLDSNEVYFMCFDGGYIETAKGEITE